MKTPYRILRSVVAVILALLSGFLISCLGIIVYNTSKDAVGVMSALFFLGMGLYIGYMVFSLVSSRGIDALNFFSGSIQAIDEVFGEANDEEERQLGAKELSEAFQQGDNLFNGGEISIWGECSGNGLQEYHELQSVSYTNHCLQLGFENQQLLTIWNPGTILETRECLEIKKASRVRWECGAEGGKSYSDYKRNGAQVNLLCSTGPDEQAFDKDLDEPALMIE